MSRKGHHEEFTRFFEHPTRDAFRELLRSHYGEMNNLDFKTTWVAYPKAARHILAMANSGGGCIIFGMEEQVDGTVLSVGLPEILDKALVSRHLSSFLPPRLLYEVLDFAFDSAEYAAVVGKRFQVVVVEDQPEGTPFLCLHDSPDTRRNAIYARKGTASEEADDLQLQGIINRRLATGHSTAYSIDIQRHLEDLKALYSASSYPGFVSDHDVDERELEIRTLIADKLLLIRHQMSIPERDIDDLRDSYR